MKRKYALLVSLILVLVLAVVGCGNSENGSSSNGESGNGSKGEKLVLRMGYVMAENSPTHEAVQEFAKNVAERTDGMIEIQPFPNSTLGSDSDVLEQAKLGTPVIAYNNPSGLSDIVPDLSILGGPFLVDDWNQLSKVINSDFMKEQEATLQENGLRVLAFNWYFGARHVISDREVKTPADLKGAKIRSSPLPMWEETIKAMGGSPTSLEWAEVYPGLEQGVIVGAEAPLETIYTSKLHEVANHISLTGHFKQVNGWLMSEKVFSSLSEEHQKILLEEAKSVGEKLTQLTIEKEKEYEQKLKDEGVTITEPDVDAFKEATLKVYDILSSSWSQGVYEKVKNEIEK
ncbi:hypothetical protein A0U40_10910 [[Bacillus] sp. KCTC 13219]|uniref:C4-dicarboxylate TRAP transporter substrate-binding protein n=1 Tax=Metasolibacillus fluoroglycofenilyticus TaxID=1239396 RepID=UPI00079B1EA9|nr:C4-dicarboxylate TRAP transporter substrate-binding protein [Metasolibacillus fluoroglycofenilyticus]KYG89301.1 hypothetical protein A0U40_10910 [[Bacillus] sp. KCTC 13219]